MHFPRGAAAIVATISVASATTIRGFNSASTLGSTPKMQSDFQAEFQNQKNIAGSDGEFNSCRLYTMIQGGTTASPISAIPAAIAEGTGLLLGLWASAGQDAFNDEITALTAAIKQYGSAFANIVQGISVGSEDLYRNSPTGIENGSDPGADPDVIVSYINQVRKAIAGTVLSSKPVGHVDTWEPWTNGTNSAVVAASDFLGVDEYPYYQSVDTNTIGNAETLFYQAIENVQNVAGSKPIWITEAGWPTSGPTVGDAVASVANAQQFWFDVFCSLPDSTPVYWYIQVGSSSDSANFGIVGDSLTTTPLYSLSCKGATPYNPSSASSSGSSSAASSTKASSSTASSSDSTSTKSSTVILGGGSSASSSASSASPTSSGSSGSSTTMTSSGSSPSATGSGSSTTVSGSNQIIGASTLSSVLTTSATASPSPSPALNSGSNTQIYTLALLIVPALLALFA